MIKEAIVFDSVGFWDMAGECHKTLAARAIREISMVPLPGDRIRFESEEQQFTVVYREFTFRNGICHIMVHVQPAVRDT